MRALKILPLAVLGLAVAGPADAQLFRGLGAQPGGAASGPAPTGPGPRPPPPALPGLASRRAPEPIPADPNQNLAPTAALFDAINRGDIFAARESVARGADLDAQNVLGLTPLDAAVDQDRREIMFFLLSVRTGRSSAPAAEPTLASRAPAERRPRRAATDRAAPAGTEEARLEAPEEPVPLPGAQATPRLWTNDGGAPVPDQGFLGFDAGRPAGAQPPAASISHAPASHAPRAAATPARTPRG